MTQEELEAAPTDRRVEDAVGDEWVKLPSGDWLWVTDEPQPDNHPVPTLSSHDLIHVWGPIHEPLL